MKGLALMLKALYPTLDWSTPEKTLESLIPGLNLADITAKFEALSGMAAAFAQAAVNMEARQSRLESMLEDLLHGRTDSNSYSGTGPGPGPAALIGPGTTDTCGIELTTAGGHE